jgi:hypothetical protein
MLCSPTCDSMPQRRKSLSCIASRQPSSRWSSVVRVGRLKAFRPGLNNCGMLQGMTMAEMSQPRRSRSSRRPSAARRRQRRRQLSPDAQPFVPELRHYNIHPWKHGPSPADVDPCARPCARPSPGTSLRGCVLALYRTIRNLPGTLPELRTHSSVYSGLYTVTVLCTRDREILRVSEHTDGPTRERTQ